MRASPTDNPSRSAGTGGPDLQGQVVLITGGGQGIGRMVAVSLAELGADIAVVARTLEGLQATAEAARAAGVRAVAVRADVSVREEIGQAVETIVWRFGRLDILIAAAGVYGPMGTVLEVDPAAWEETIRINLLGTFYSMRAVLPVMVRQHRGKIVAFSGGGAVSPRPRFSAYATSKAGVVRLVETVAAEVAELGIDVNAVAPGGVPTRLHDEVLRHPERAGEAEVRKAKEIKEGGGGATSRLLALVRFLASDASHGLTGRLISAVWDDWESLPERIAEIRGTDLYTMRRVTGSSSSSL